MKFSGSFIGVLKFSEVAAPGLLRLKGVGFPVLCQAFGEVPFVIEVDPTVSSPILLPFAYLPFITAALHKAVLWGRGHIPAT